MSTAAITPIEKAFIFQPFLNELTNQTENKKATIIPMRGARNIKAAIFKTTGPLTEDSV